MINLIKGGIRKGDKTKCIPSKDILVDTDGKRVAPGKLDEFMAVACSEILNNADSTTFDTNSGVLDKVN